MASPTQRCLQKLRKDEWIAAIVERWVPQAFKRTDLFGIIDLLAIKPGKILGIQTTSGSNASAHVHKALAEPRLQDWLRAGGLFQLWSWSKRGKKGKRKLWTLRKQEFLLIRGDIQVVEITDPD